MCAVVLASRLRSVQKENDDLSAQLRAATAPAPPTDGVYTIQLMHMNDVYELNTLGGYGTAQFTAPNTSHSHTYHCALVIDEHVSS